LRMKRHEKIAPKKQQKLENQAQKMG